MSQVTQLLQEVQDGNLQAAERLLPVVYDELRRLAAHRLRREAAGQTLEATALVHEAYVRLVDSDRTTEWDSRRHFFAAAAEAMRRILVERARHKRRLKHGGGARRVELDVEHLFQQVDCDQLLAVHEALAELEQHDVQVATLVKLRYFAGFSHQEAGRTLGVSRRVADRLWAVGRAWLHQRLGEA